MHAALLCGCKKRFIGSIRRDMLDHVVLLGQDHLARLLSEYIRYYHADRTHLGLDKDCPEPRAVTPRPSGNAELVARPRIGGIHHRYEWRVSA